MSEAEKAPKVYDLTSAETRGITFRNSLANHYDYLTNLIRQDLSIYVNQLMKSKGVGDNEQLLRLDIGEGKIITSLSPEPVPAKEGKQENGGKSKKHKD